MTQFPSIDPKEVLSLSWTAYFVPPASWSKTKQAAAIGTLHRSKPDRDNIDKAILDAMFDEDCAIADGEIKKFWGTVACVEIVIVMECNT
jgi:Holliday junction resolvase RusA-like endonuclease